MELLVTEPFQPDLSKPGKKKKAKRPKIKPPKEKHCRFLGYTTGTERWCHAESRLIKMEHGGGIVGSKIPDDQTAWLSFRADQILSQPLPKDASQEALEKHAEEWRRLIKLSHGD